MYRYHPKLVSIVTEQTQRAMIALIIVSLVYFWVFFKFVPLSFLIIWLFLQVFLGYLRLHNAKILNTYLTTEDTVKIRQHVIYFVTIIILQASMWTIASILSVIYAPAPFELVTFVMIIGIITAAVLSMSSIFYAYVIFFFFMIIPQIIIMLYYGEHQHIALVLFSLIYIPSTIFLSKSIYNSHVRAIKNQNDLKTSVKELHKLSTIDSLTNIYNRRYFFEMAQNLITLALRKKKDVSMLMIDIDFFKKINDNHGHLAGDFILASLATEVKNIMRESDIFARVGGEEFAVILYNTPLNGAKVIAEKIREKIENKIFTFNDTSITLTVSIGTSTLEKSSDTIKELYKKADDKLYKAKKEGRNRVC